MLASDYLPLVRRELQAQSRLWRTYWSRVGYALIALFLGGGAVAVFGGVLVRTQPMFRFYAVALFIVALSSATRTADSIIREKKEGTLGLLFLTDLKPIDIILGKLAAAAVPLVFGMISTFPIMGLVMIYGGVDLPEFFRTCLAILNAGFFAMAVGLFFSTTNQEYRPALSATYFVVMVSWWGLSLAALILSASGFPPWITQTVEIFNPYVALTAAASSTWMFSETRYWLSLLGVHALSWFILYHSARILPKVWQDRPIPTQRFAAYQAAIPAPVRSLPRLTNQPLPPLPGNPLPPLPGRSHGQTVLKIPSHMLPRRQRQRYLLDLHPFAWLASRNGSGAGNVWFFLGLIAAFWIVLSFFFITGNTSLRALPKIASVSSLVFCGLALLLLKMWIIDDSSRPISRENVDGTLELLLATPMDEHEIAKGQYIGLKQRFLKPVAVVCSATLFMSAMCALFTQAALIFAWAVAVVGIFLLEITSLRYVGLWSGLHAKSERGATRNALLALFTCPVFLIVIIGGIGSASVRSIHLAPLWLAVYVVISAGLNLVFLAWAKRQVRTQMRAIAFQRYSPPMAWWQRWLGRS